MFKKALLLALVIVLSCWITNSIAGVLMQAFYWDVPAGGTWYDTVKAKADELKAAGFTAIWLPPPSKCDNGAYSMGYDPFDLYDLGEYNQKGSIETRFGSKAELKSCVSTYRNKGMDVYLDIVLNHMSGGASQYNPNTGTNTWTSFLYPHGTFQRGYNDFHPSTYRSSDEGVFGGFPDVCHSNPYVKDGLIAWGNWLKTELGVNGWRFDYVKGFGGWVIRDFLNGTGNNFAVGEYWDSNVTLLNNWINSTEGKASAFDFALFYKLKDMCNNTSGSFYAGDLDHAGLVGSNPTKAVTFVENHDTDHSDPIVSDKMMAYAYILTAEGYPTVFWKDYYNYGLKPEIDKLVWVHEKYAGGTTSNLWKDGDAYIAQRNGYGSQPGCIIFINDNATYDANRTVTTKWANTVLQECTGKANQTTNSSGTVTLSAPKRGYSVYIPSPCGGDTYEVNDIAPGYGVIASGTTYNSKICTSTDIDYYKFEVKATGNINVYCSVPSGKDYDVELYNPSGTKVASGNNGAGTAENFNYNATTTGFYYVKVLGYNGAYDVTNQYGLKVTYPNSSDTPPTVSITSPANGSTVSGTVNITASASDDKGISKVEIYVDGALKVSDTAAPYEYSWNTSGLTGSHTIYAKAFDTINQSTQSSTVTVTIGTCTDSYEPNDSFSASYGNITSGNTYTGKICSSSDVDYFKFSLTSTGSITVNCTIPSGKDYDVYLYNPSQNKVASGTNGAGVTENFTYNATVTGTYYVQVVGYNGAYDITNTYGLKVTWGSPTCSDTYEPNDSFSAAYGNLTSGTNYTSKICSGTDIDYYKFSVPKTGTITVFCDVPSDKDYDVNLYDPSQTLKAAGTAASGVDENFTYNATTTGTWYIKVFGYSGAYSTTSSYVLRVTYPTSTGVASITLKPSVYSLEQNYPNPFNPSTTISYSLPENANVNLSIYNIKGELVRTLVSENQLAGNYSVKWDGKDDNDKSVPSGMYLYRLQAGNFTSVKRMVMTK